MLACERGDNLLRTRAGAARAAGEAAGERAQRREFRRHRVRQAGRRAREKRRRAAYERTDATRRGLNLLRHQLAEELRGGRLGRVDPEGNVLRAVRLVEDRERSRVRVQEGIQFLEETFSFLGSNSDNTKMSSHRCVCNFYRFILFAKYIRREVNTEKKNLLK